MNEQKLRSIIRQAINEAGPVPVSKRRALNEEGGALYKAFVEPFVDVVQSANLFTKDVLNIFGLAFETLITFSPEKLAKARDKYEGRRNKIAQEWKPIIDRAGKSLENADIGLITMAFAPNIFFANQVAQLGSAGYDTVGEYLGAMGIIDYVSKEGGSLADKLESWLERQDRAGQGGGGGGGRGGGDKTIADRLRIFFLGEDASPHGDILVEAEDEGNKKDKPSPSSSELSKQISDLFGPQGPLADLFSETQKELLSAKDEEARDLIGTANIVVGGLRTIAQAQKIDDFESAVANLKGQLGQKGDDKTADLTPIEKGIQSLKSEMEKKYNEVIGQKGTAAKSPAPQGAKPEDIETVAKKASEDAFSKGAEELRRMAADAADKASENYKKTIFTELTSDLKGPVEKSPMGKALIEKFKKAVEDIGR